MTSSQRVPRVSQCEKIMRVLRDGRWHTAAEIHQIAGFSRLNSRISDLRRQGHVIEHETTGVGAGGSRYRLLDTAHGASPIREAIRLHHPVRRVEQDSARGPCGSPPIVSPQTDTRVAAGTPAPLAEQLSLEAA